MDTVGQTHLEGSHDQPQTEDNTCGCLLTTNCTVKIVRCQIKQRQCCRQSRQRSWHFQNVLFLYCRPRLCFQKSLHLCSLGLSIAIFIEINIYSFFHGVWYSAGQKNAPNSWHIARCQWLLDKDWPFAIASFTTPSIVPFSALPLISNTFLVETTTWC